MLNRIPLGVAFFIAFVALKTRKYRTLALGVLLAKLATRAGTLKKLPDSKKRTAVVTGGASGVGRATCELLLSLGWTVIACDVNVDGLATLPDDIHSFVLDVRDVDAPARLVEFVTEKSPDGTLDALINVAGVVQAKPIMSLSDAEMNLVFDVNVFGPMRLMRECMGVLLEGKSASRQAFIVNVASVGGRMAWPWTGG